MSVDLIVVGLGYVGLPLAVEAASAGLTTIGLDQSHTVVDGLNSGRSHVDDIPHEAVRRVVALGFRAETDPAVLATADVIVICVPTPLTKAGGPDLTAVRSAIADVAAHLRRGQLVILESTTYPGTTQEVAKPILEGGGLKAGVDFHLAFSPERIDPGNPVFGVGNTPKVVGGVTPECTEVAAAFYARFIDRVVPARGAREAEMAKLLENTYRHVNIALVNELARFCHELDIDIWNVIELASTKPFGFQPFYPGPGVGGHCIPIDPMYLSYKVRTELGEPSQFIELAQLVNTGMPAYVVARCASQLRGAGLDLMGAEILLLGVTYKPDIADVRESPAADLALEFTARGARVSFHDPLINSWEVSTLGALKRVLDLDAALSQCDLAVLVQEHSAYDLQQLARDSRLLFDSRGHVPLTAGVERL